MALQHCPLNDWVLPEIKLDHLKEIEDHVLTSDCPHHSPDLKDLIFNRCGSTPLILACEQGEFDSVKYLVETWGVDVRTPATYYSPSTLWHSSMTLKATPLFAAAFHGYDQIVRYLLEEGAQVSVKTSAAKDTGNPDIYELTPLYGAVCKWHCYSRPYLEQLEERNAVVRSLLEFGADPNTDAFSRGRPMWMEPMCGADAIRALIHHGLDLNWHMPETHKTLLHHMAELNHGFTEEDSLSIVELLIEKGANLLARDIEGFTPLLTAADDLYNDYWSLKLAVFDFLLEREEYSLMEKIEAMELAGGTILFRKQNGPYSPKAFEYWRRAHHLRQMEKEASGSSKEKILGRKIGHNVEWTTLDELDQLEQHPEDYQIQGLLVKLRILSRFAGDGHHQVSSQYIYYLSDSTSSLENEEKFNQILDIRWGKLDQLIHRSDFFPPDVFIIWKEIKVGVDYLISTLSSIEQNHPELLNFERIKTSWDLIVQTTDSSSSHMVTDEEDEDDYERLIQFYKKLFNQSLFNLLEMVFRLPEMPNEHNIDRLIQSLRQLEPCRLGNLLLTACQKLSDSKYSALVRFLLEAGADPDVAVDDAGNSSLHVVAQLIDPILSEAISTLLLEKGAHADRVNKAGKTAVDVWIETHIENGAEAGWSARPKWCRTAPKLLCLASRIIQVHKIPYKDAPVTLHSIVAMH